MAIILDGKALAQAQAVDLRTRAAAFAQRYGRPVGLGVVLVGDDAASAVYVRNKARQAAALGMASQPLHLPATASQTQIIAAVAQLNDNPRVDSFLVQLPLPAGIDAAAVLAHIAPHKDADGLHPVNLGRLLAGVPAAQPCTPAAVMALLAQAFAVAPPESLAVPQVAGAHAVIVGRSTIVGKPLALLLLQAHATVTVCHAQTRQLAAHVAQADILVAAVGRPALLPGAWLQPGAVVIDVGINRVAGRLVGDVDYPSAVQRAGAITPVPGGVGPMTIAMLMHNAVAGAWAQAELTAAVDSRARSSD